MEKRLFTSESVTEGHPDKVCDAISDAILDACMAEDPMSRVACETASCTGFVLVTGEITTKAQLDIPAQTGHERYLTEKIFKRPVFVTDYPKEIKAFYMKLNEDGKTVAAMDCLVPGIGEIIGGSQREDDLAVLKARMAECGLKEEDYGFYLDLRKYGTARHAGFGLGFERCVMYLTGMGNIRDVIPFPRTVGNCEL